MYIKNAPKYSITYFLCKVRKNAYSLRLNALHEGLEMFFVEVLRNMILRYHIYYLTVYRLFFVSTVVIR